MVCSSRTQFTHQQANTSFRTSPSTQPTVSGISHTHQWSFSTLATSREELTYWKRPWCWEGLGAGGEGDNRRWDGWMALPTQWTWVWVNFRSWWWTGRPGMLRFMGSQRVKHNWTELNWTEPVGQNQLGDLCLSEKINKIDKPLARLIKKNKRKGTNMKWKMRSNKWQHKNMKKNRPLQTTAWQ